jgi:hypothetical protein
MGRCTTQRSLFYGVLGKFINKAARFMQNFNHLLSTQDAVEILTCLEWSTNCLHPPWSKQTSAKCSKRYFGALFGVGQEDFQPVKPCVAILSAPKEA